MLLGEELHFSRAAERAHLSQTAFSRSIQSLEADLGVRLFDRNTRSVTLTSVGQQLIARAHELLSCADKLVAEANDIAGVQGGELRFGTSMMAANTVIPSVLEELRRGAPRLNVLVEVNYWRNLRRSLELDRIEFVMMATQVDWSPDPRFTVRPLPPKPGSIFCRRDHPLTQQTSPISREQILAFPWAAVNNDDAHIRALLEVPAGTPLPWGMICNELSWLRHATLTSNTLLCTWKAWLESDLESAAIVDLAPYVHPPIPAELLNIQETLVFHAGRTLSPIARKTVELIIEKSEQFYYEA